MCRHNDGDDRCVDESTTTTLTSPRCERNQYASTGCAENPSSGFSFFLFFFRLSFAHTLAFARVAPRGSRRRPTWVEASTHVGRRLSFLARASHCWPRPAAGLMDNSVGVFHSRRRPSFLLARSGSKEPKTRTQPSCSLGPRPEHRPSDPCVHGRRPRQTETAISDPPKGRRRRSPRRTRSLPIRPPITIRARQSAPADHDHAFPAIRPPRPPLPADPNR